jgi:GNAT superfamily N-acetyltransferase
MSPTDRRAEADANLTAAFDLVREHVGDLDGDNRRFGSVRAIRSGIDAGFYNPVLALGPLARLDEIERAVAWIEARGLPTTVHVSDVADPALTAGLLAAGFAPDPDPSPIMVLDPIPAAQVRPVGLEVRTGGVELYEAWHDTLESGPRFRRIFGLTLAADPRVRFAIAALDGTPISVAAAISSGTTIGIYAVGTVEKARGNGGGRAVMWAAIEAGRAAWGADHVVLQSSPMALDLYRSMGFVEIGSITVHGRAG